MILKNIFKSKLVGNTAIYALANVLNGAIPFLLLPILTRVFTPEEYGLVTLISAVIAIMGAFTGLSVHGAVNVKYFDKEIDHPKFVGASLMVLAGSTCAVLVFLLFAGGKLSEWIHLPKQWLIIAAIASAAQFVINIRLTMWQVQEKATRYGFFQVTQTFFNLTLSLALVFWILLGWEGRTWGIVIAMIVFGSLAIVSLHREKLVHWRGDKQYAKAAMRFGVPLIPHVVGALAISVVDRPLIASILGAGSLGNYAVGMQLAMIVGMLSHAALNAYLPYLYHNLSKDDYLINKSLVCKTYVMFGVILLMTFLYSFVLPFIFQLFVGERFSGSLYIAKIAIVGYAFEGMYYMIAGLFFHKSKTALLSSITITCGVIGICLTYILVKNYGIEGAAWAFVITQAIYFICTWIISMKIAPLPWFSYDCIGSRLDKIS